MILKRNCSCTTHNATAVLRCAFLQQETSCLLKVLDWKASSSVFSLANHLFLKNQSVQASSMSSGETLLPRKPEGSYFEPRARFHSSRSHGFTVASSVKLWQNGGCGLSCPIQSYSSAAGLKYHNMWKRKSPLTLEHSKTLNV